MVKCGNYLNIIKAQLVRFGNNMGSVKNKIIKVPRDVREISLGKGLVSSGKIYASSKWYETWRPEVSASPVGMSHP